MRSFLDRPKLALLRYKQSNRNLHTDLLLCCSERRVHHTFADYRLRIEIRLRSGQKLMVDEWDFKASMTVGIESCRNSTVHDKNTCYRALLIRRWLPESKRWEPMSHNLDEEGQNKHTEDTTWEALHAVLYRPAVSLYEGFKYSLISAGVITTIKCSWHLSITFEHDSFRRRTCSITRHEDSISRIRLFHPIWVTSQWLSIVLYCVVYVYLITVIGMRNVPERSIHKKSREHRESTWKYGEGWGCLKENQCDHWCWQSAW